jgi:peptidase M28-like protein
MRTSPAVRGLGGAVGLLLLIGAAIAYATHVPRPVAASAPATVFSADRAMRHVRAMAQRPRPPGSADHARVRSYLVAELAALGLSPEVQATTGIGTRYAAAGRVENVVVRAPGRQAGGPAVLLMAHYDGVPAGPAAGDDASGSAVLLETLRAVRAGTPLAHGVIALFTDGEELGLLGAAAFVREHPWAKDVAVVLDFEGRGSGGPSLMFETGPGNLDAARVLRTVPGVRATSLSTAVYREMPNDTDLSELAALGTPALNFAFIGGVDRYHTALDDVADLDAGSVQHHGDQALALARRFADGPLPRPVTRDAVFFDVPALGLIVYPEGWALPLAIVACLLVAAGVVRAARAESRPARGIAVGFLVVLFSLIVALFAGLAVATVLGSWHARRAGGGTPASSGLYATGIALLAVAIVAGAYALARRWGGAMSVRTGALVVWAVVAIAVSAVAPGASFFFTWPLIAAAGAAAFASGGAAPGAVAVGTALRWLAAAIVIAILAPTTYLMACVGLGLDATGGTLLAILTALGVWLLAPHLEAIAGGSSRSPALAGRLSWTPAIAAASLAAGAVALGAATVRTDADHPDGASLVYAIDTDAGRAWLTGYAGSGAARAWLGQTLGPASAREALPSWAAAYARDRRGRAVPVADATPIGPSASIVADSLVAGAREVTLRVRGVPGTFGLLMRVDSAAVLRATIDGRPIRSDRYRRGERLWPLQYVAPPDSGFVLTLTLPAAAPAALHLETRVSGIPPLAGVTIPPRPVGVVPIQSGDMTVRARRISLAAGASRSLAR